MASPANVVATFTSSGTNADEQTISNSNRLRVPSAPPPSPTSHLIAESISISSLGCDSITWCLKVHIQIVFIVSSMVASDSPALNQINVDLSIGIIDACAWLTYWTPVAIKVISHNFAVSAIKFDAAIL